MGFQPEIVTLTVDGQALQGWQGVHVTRSAKAAAIGFTLRAANPGWSAQARLVRKGKEVKIYTAPATAGALGTFNAGKSDLLCTGYADDYEVESAPGVRDVGISGRSKAGDAIDCPPVKHKTGLEENKTLLEAAKAFDEWGINFTSDVVLQKLREIQLVPGEPLFSTLEREARHCGVLLTGQPDGGVKITRGGKGRHAGTLVHGQPPCKRWKLACSIENKRSKVHVRGQRSLGTDEDALRQEETAEDDSVGRHRPAIVHHEGDHVDRELKRRAEWEQLRRSGSGISIQVKVATWRDEAGKLWEPGSLVAVQWEDEEIDQDLAISTVVFNQVTGEGESEVGTWADLTLVDPRTLGGKKPSEGGDNGGPDGADGVFSPGLDDAQLDDKDVTYDSFSKRGPA
ncbi:hypothetical protein MFUR16E_04760 [Methylobacterium fujisawaense]|uniref:phage baseplate assembly protein n=1 Tax=Methylobacterium fujisawaense TaxID=107400 RepID=UPI002F32502F